MPGAWEDTGVPRDFAPSVTDEIVRRYHERGGQPAIAYGIVLQAIELAIGQPEWP